MPWSNGRAVTIAALLHVSTSRPLFQDIANPKSTAVIILFYFIFNSLLIKSQGIVLSNVHGTFDCLRLKRIWTDTKLNESNVHGTVYSLRLKRIWLDRKLNEFDVHGTFYSLRLKRICAYMKLNELDGRNQEWNPGNRRSMPLGLTPGFKERTSDSSKYIKGSKERYLLGQNTICSFRGRGDHLYEATKRHLNGEKRWKIRWRAKPLICFGLSCVVFVSEDASSHSCFILFLW